MRRGAKPGKTKVKARLPVARKSPKNEASGRRELEKRLAESLEREKASGKILQEKDRALAEAIDQQTAMSEILRVISSSPTDVQPTFDAIATSATQLCGAVNGLVFRFDGRLMHVAAHHNLSAERRDALGRTFPVPPSRGSVSGRAILTRSVVQVPDVLQDSEYTLPIATTAGYRSALAVPMLRDGVPIGNILVARDHVAPFSDKQIALLQTFADQAVIAIENVRLFTELDARNRDLTEALEQQTATAEILRAISSSPTDIRPVLETLVHAAARFCGAVNVALLSLDGGVLRGAAVTGPFAEELARRFGGVEAIELPVSGGSATGRAVSECRTVHIHDLAAEPEGELPIGRELQRQLGHHTMVATPLLREGVPIGAIDLFRTEVKPFTEKQLALLRTFADQAVIAIENVRLFTELQASNRELTTALDTQTATSDILRVISQSQTDVQPVFDAIAESAVRLCDGLFGAVFRFDGELMHFVAHHHFSGEALDLVQRQYPRPPRGLNGSAILDRAVAHSADVLNDPRTANPDLARVLGYRSLLAVPILRESQAIGAIVVYGADAVPFSEEQIALLKTFADQALIAIENVRLFTELAGRNRDLTATSEILRVISSSPTDVEPVFDTIIRSAVRLCDGRYGSAVRFDGEMMHLAAGYNYTPEVRQALEDAFPMRPDRRMMAGRAILARAVIQVEDALEDPEYPQHVARAGGFRSMLAVPMMREGNPIGAIVVNRGHPGRFSASQIDLLKTFADQAVIAVENVRLFKELEARTGELTQSVEQLTALGEVSRAVTSTLDVETVLDTIVSRASQLAGGAGCSIYEYDEAAEQFALRATHHDDAAFVEALRAVPLRKGEGLMGRAAEMREPIQIPDITQPGAYQSSVRDTLIRFGYRALLSVPLLREDQVIGSLSLTRKEPGEYAPEVIDVLKSFATQSALAIQNARLFREIADKSAQLEAASRHKSEFLANMSHELRTPLNAIIGFSEVLTERMFGELNDKQAEYLRDIHASGTHLLSLINDILDLSKIEAGRMELELSEFDLPTAVDNALILVRERASRRGITLGSTIDPRLGSIGGDERKVKQVLLNLLSNALKFTLEGGRIDVSARFQDGSAEVSVADTGVGIAPEDQEAVFEEFRQVGGADKKAEGTGLGLALCRKFVELHGGRIWVKSAVGVGSTFTFTLPVRS